MAATAPARAPPQPTAAPPAPACALPQLTEAPRFRLLVQAPCSSMQTGRLGRGAGTVTPPAWQVQAVCTRAKPGRVQSCAGGRSLKLSQARCPVPLVTLWTRPDGAQALIRSVGVSRLWTCAAGHTCGQRLPGWQPMLAQVQRRPDACFSVKQAMYVCELCV